MTPAITLSLTAQGLHVASAVIGQQMRMTDAFIDQASAAQAAMLGGVVPPMTRPDQANASLAPKIKPAAAKAPARPVAVVATEPEVKEKAQTVTQPRKPVKTASVAAAPAPAVKAAVPNTPVATAPAKPQAAPKKAVSKPAATPNTAAAPAKPEVKPAQAKAPAGKRTKAVSVSGAPWDGKGKPKAK